MPLYIHFFKLFFIYDFRLHFLVFFFFLFCVKSIICWKVQYIITISFGFNTYKNIIQFNGFKQIWTKKFTTYIYISYFQVTGISRLASCMPGLPGYVMYTLWWVKMSVQNRRLIILPTLSILSVWDLWYWLIFIPSELIWSILWSSRGSDQGYQRRPLMNSLSFFSFIFLLPNLSLRLNIGYNLLLLSVISLGNCLNAIICVLQLDRRRLQNFVPIFSRLKFCHYSPWISIISWS